MVISDIARFLLACNHVGIATHVMPDGDAIGSVLAIALALEKKGLHPVVIKNDIVPRKYLFLPGQHLVKEYSQAPSDLDALVVLDCGDLERLGEAKELTDRSKTVINIDHHISNTLFGSYNLVDTNAAAAAEIVYQLIKLMGVEIDLDIGTCLYTAIIADTGGFKYDNTTPVTHAIAGEMISIGVNVSHVARRVFNNRTLSQTRLIGKAIDSLDIYHGGKTAVMCITRDTIEETGSSYHEVEGVIEYARDIEGVEVAVLIKEIGENHYRVGFRSKVYVDVSEIASHFGGGGHRKASGCTVEGDLKEVKKLLLKEIKKAYG